MGTVVEAVGVTKVVAMLEDMRTAPGHCRSTDAQMLRNDNKSHSSVALSKQFAIRHARLMKF